MGEKDVKPFSELLTDLEFGRLDQDVSKATRQLMDVLQKHADTFGGVAKGMLTLTLNFKVEKDGTTEVLGDVKVKEPKSQRRKTMLWVDKGGNLVTSDPRQLQLPTKEAPAPKGGAQEAPSKDDRPAREAPGDKSHLRSV